jgi:hypothetical protein
MPGVRTLAIASHATALLAAGLGLGSGVRTLTIATLHATALLAAGAQRNNTFYAQLMKESGKNYTIENCHWGAMNSIGCLPGDDASACPSQDWCPFNWYRSSGDINSGSNSWYSNLQSVIPYLAKDKPLSRQGCWACECNAL